MKKLLSILLLLFICACSKPKTVLICGDHVCVNKDEANQYFEKNLSLEVRIIDDKQKKSVDLVQLNLKENSNNKKRITVQKKEKTSKKVKKLSNKEIKKIKSSLKQKKKKSNKIKKKEFVKKIDKETKLKSKKEKKEINVNKNDSPQDDICTFLEKCSIDEISKYLIKHGNFKKFPDITIRE